MSDTQSHLRQIPEELIAGTNPGLPEAISKAEADIAEGASVHDVLSGLAVFAYFAGYSDNAGNNKDINKRAEAVQSIYGEARAFSKRVEEALERVKE